jgi:hypothetical protein
MSLVTLRKSVFLILVCLASFGCKRAPEVPVGQIGSYSETEQTNESISATTDPSHGAETAQLDNFAGAIRNEKTWGITDEWLGYGSPEGAPLFMLLATVAQECECKDAELLAELETEANRGNSIALLLLGGLSDGTQNTPRNLELQRSQWIRAAESGGKGSRLAYLYLKARGTNCVPQSVGYKCGN